MNKPIIILKEYLIMPILATEARIDEIKKEVQQNTSDVLTPIKQECSFKFRLLIMRLNYPLKSTVCPDSISPLV